MIALAAVQAVRDVPKMPLYVTMLGYDPNITLPMLEQYVRDKGVYDSDDAED